MVPWMIDIRHVRTPATPSLTSSRSRPSISWPIAFGGKNRGLHGLVLPSPSVTNELTVNLAVTLICGPPGDPPHVIKRARSQ